MSDKERIANALEVINAWCRFCPIGYQGLDQCANRRCVIWLIEQALTKEAKDETN